MHGPFEGDTVELVLALARCPAGRATSAEPAARVGRPLGVVSRALRAAERRGLVGSSTTLSAQPGRDRVFWLSAKTGAGPLAHPERDQPAGD